MINKELQTGQSGFTIFELMIVMLVISLFAAPLAFQNIQQFEEDRIEIAVAEINDLFQSAQNYAAERNGNWPNQGAACSNAINRLKNSNYLDGFSIRSPFGTNFNTSCTTGDGKRFIVRLNAGSAGNAEMLKSYLPSSSTTGSIVRVSVPMPASIPALTHLLPRDGSREMTGDLDMGGNTVTNAEDVEVNSISANASEGIYFAGIVNNGAYVDKPQCPAGLSPTPIVVPTGMSDNGRAHAIGAVYAWAQNSGSRWRIRLRISVKRDGNWRQMYPSSRYGKLAVFKKCA